MTTFLLAFYKSNLSIATGIYPYTPVVPNEFHAKPETFKGIKKQLSPPLAMHIYQITTTFTDIFCRLIVFPSSRRKIPCIKGTQA